MTRERLVNLHNYLYFTYKKKMKIVFVDTESDDFGAFIFGKRIEIPIQTKTNPTEWTLFAFLHEIGHVLTNTPEMARYEKEYLATKWALKEAEHIGFQVPKQYIETYQKYIWRWRDRNAKTDTSIPNKNELKLQ